VPDYDVGVLGLSVPPAAAVKTTYRPAVSVRNNGLHDALASGYVRIYKAGLLVYESEVYSPTIHPGATSLAQAIDYWTPDIGQYMVQGYVTCPLDSVEPNNNLAPVTVVVGEGPIPPTPPVTLHASQHEEGGADEVSIDGLPGRARDPQVPYDHVSNHEPGGSDELDVTNLEGELADPQKPLTHATTHEPGGTDPISGIAPSAHKTTHEAGGDDELDVTGLDGILLLPQPTIIHGDETHVTPYQPTDEKGEASGYAPLGADSKVPNQYLPSFEALQGLATLQTGLSGPLDWYPIIHGTAPAGLDAGAVVHLTARGTIVDPVNPPWLSLKVYARIVGSPDWTHIAESGLLSPDVGWCTWTVDFDLVILLTPSSKLSATGLITGYRSDPAPVLLCLGGISPVMMLAITPAQSLEFQLLYKSVNADDQIDTAHAEIMNVGSPAP
jgi:hypothetical protein